MHIMQIKTQSVQYMYVNVQGQFLIQKGIIHCFEKLILLEKSRQW